MQGPRIKIYSKYYLNMHRLQDLCFQVLFYHLASLPCEMFDCDTPLLSDHSTIDHS